jgi:hypothetical protein
MAKKHLCLLDDAGADEREKLITVTGSMSTTFHHALDVALDNEAPAEQQNEIAKIVAMESLAQDYEVISGLADKNSNGYMLNNVDAVSTDIGSDEIVVDVHNAENPDNDQLIKGMSMLELVENGTISTEQYVPVFVYSSQKAVRERNLMAGFESLCNKAGVKICRLVQRS